MKSWRGVLFAVLCAVCVAVPIVYVLSARRLAERPVPDVPPAPRAQAPVAATAPGPATAPAQADASVVRAARPGPAPAETAAVRLPAPVPTTRAARPGASQMVVYRYTGVDALHGRLARGELEAPGAPLPVGTLECDRVHMGRAGGVCLTTQRRAFPVRYEVVLFDGDFRVRHTLALSGVPSRARVSPDGRLAAVTVFESGHSYASANFSTRTSVIDLVSGDFLILDLEKFPVFRDDAPFHAIDFNVWGVTFAATGDRFYATLGTAGRTYLVEGDLAKRQMRVLREGVECPSLSPDGGLIAFKRREGGRLRAVTWRLSVIRLDTLAEWTLAETRSVDDQVEWLDDTTILYSLPEAASGTPVQNTWAVPADGSGSPRLVVAKAYSLVVVRGSAPGEASRRQRR